MLTYEVWDKRSPINGVAAEKFIARNDVDPRGEIYLIKENGNILFFQPHAPFEPGFVLMTPETVHDYAKAHIEQIEESRKAVTSEQA